MLTRRLPVWAWVLVVAPGLGWSQAPTIVRLIDPTAQPPAPPPTNDCDAYCAQMDLRCPDVFLGNLVTCKDTCALYPPGRADFDTLQCRIFGADEGAIVAPMPPPVDPEGGSTEAANVLDDHPQLRTEGSVVPEGFGAVFFPAIGLDSREPIVSVREGKKDVAEGPAGRRIILPPGHYTARLGNGAEADQIVHEFDIFEGHTTVPPTDWSALEVSVVDAQFIPFRGSYELIRFATREVVGLGFGADALLGERLGVWIVPPGLYRLIQPGGTFRDRTNFATVRLDPGRLTRFVLVLDPETGDLLGAGEIDPSQLTELGAWLLRGVIGGNLAANHVRDLGWTFTGSVTLDGQVQLNAGDHQWTTRVELEEAQEYDAQQLVGDEKFRVRSDRFFTNSIYIYSLVSWFGPYIRAGFEAQLSRRDQNDQFPNPDQPQVGEPFSPMVLFQGAGGNFRVWRSRDAELNLRVGFGPRQVIPNGLRLYDPDTGTLTKVASAHTEGIEGSAVGFARLTRYVTASTNFEGNQPLSGTSNRPVFNWRNQIGLRLSSYASLNYRLNAELDPPKGIETTVVEQDIQLRFSFAIF